jgi:hypothetical protein
MNCFYHYKYLNGLQFVSIDNETLIRLKVDFGCELPKIIGVWRIKKLTNKNK